MKFHLISDNIDTIVGMRLAGITGVLVHEDEEVKKALTDAMAREDVAVILMTEKLVKLLDDHRAGKADNSRRVWTVYTFLVWYDQFFNDDILNGYAEHTDAKTA